jgi:uncharacterized protein YhbP (UPF0306 family)
MYQLKLVNISSTNVRGYGVKIEGLSQDRIWGSLQQILESTELCAVATVAAGGQAYVNTAYFAYSDQLEIYFLSHPSSSHCQNLIANASAALAVFSSSQKWEGPDCGAQLFGLCCRISASEARKAEQPYARRFPGSVDRKAGLPGSDPALEYCFYRFVTQRLKILDEREFGEAIFVQADVERAG